MSTTTRTFWSRVRRRRPRHELGEVGALQELHGDEEGAVRLAQLVDGHDVGVGQARGRPRLALKARAGVDLGQERGGHRLERHQPVEDRIAGTVDRPHRPPAQLALELELAEVAETGQETMIPPVRT